MHGGRDSAGVLVAAAAVSGASSGANAATNTGQVGNVRGAGPNGTFVSNEDPAGGPL
jgi:hypothetical protein